MKKFTDSKQTETLISLGFPLPSTVVDINDCYIVDRYGAQEVECDECNYSIGELLSFLPLTIQWTPRVIRGNTVEYSFVTEGSELYYCNAHNELIDNLFSMVVQLKEERVI